jgi:pimeloyl-ACP methyl ester carboxylesterase
VAAQALQRVSVNGVPGCFTDAGRGPTLVLLTSPFARAEMYRPTIETLARRFRVIAVEMPGCGCGGRLDKAWDFEGYARWVVGFLTALELDDVLLIGHSHSGVVALLVGARWPERVTALVLADTVGAGGPRSILAVLAGCALCIPLELHFVLRGTPRLFYNLLRHGRNFLVQFWRAVRADVRPEAHRVQRPVLLAWGALDLVMPVSAARRLVQSLPNAQLYISARGSHDWLIERADEFAEAVQEFSSRVRPSACDATKFPFPSGLGSGSLS